VRVQAKEDEAMAIINIENRLRGLADVSIEANPNRKVRNIRDCVNNRIARNQSGGVAVVILFAFAALAVPAVIGANRLSDQIFGNLDVESRYTLTETIGVVDDALSLDDSADVVADDGAVVPQKNSH